MAKEIKTEILIQASPEKIWEILIDFKNYKNWNPFIKTISGHTETGKKIDVYIALSEKKVIALRPKILIVEENKEFRWKGKSMVTGLFDGEHIFELVDNGNGSTTFIQRELFEGILIPFFSKMLNVNTMKGFKLMNQKLKEMAERD